MARVFREVGAVVRAKNIKEIIRYMRIKRLKSSSEHKKSKIAPAEWQEFIEI
ncbi:hypothetical protein IKD82_01985 [Candidatus Saccharibacteria bacterium]|nr:hypothetical protein [Candidatus Saccharibacteria bacterium]